MRQHPATGPGISPYLAYLSGPCEWALVLVSAPEEAFWFRGLVRRGTVGGMQSSAGRSAAEFPTLDFRVT